MPDYSAVPLIDCPCGGNHQVKDAGLHAKTCQNCWRENLPCIVWRGRYGRWLCTKCWMKKKNNA